MTALRIIGAGGHGKVAADTAAALGYADIAFLDRSWPDRTSNGAWPIIGLPDAAADMLRFCAVGDNAARARLWDTLDLEGAPCLVHPFTSVSPQAQIGAGTLIAPGAVVNVDATIGRGVILNTGCSVDHDCVLGDFVHISPGARLAANVRVGAGAWIGIGAAVREGVTIGAGALVAAGAAVTEDIPDNARVGGVPARPLT